jgi:hypothetical protein
MAKSLEYKTETIRTKDNDGDVHSSELTYAVVDENTAGTEVVLRDGVARTVAKGEVVMRAGNYYDVFSEKDWENMMNDSDRVVKDEPVDESLDSSEQDPAVDLTDISSPAKKAAPARRV